MHIGNESSIPAHGRKFLLCGVITSIFVVLCGVGYAQENAEERFEAISGLLPERMVSGGKPYLVTGDIYVAPGATVSIEPGTVILFEAFTGLHVQGTLIAPGTADKPIVFTSRNDVSLNRGSNVNAAPYDWNGIDVYETAVGTRFDHCSIRYSIYGIRSQTPYLKITKSSFGFNGKGAVSIRGERQEVGTDPFTYGASAVEIKPPVDDPSPQTVDRLAGRRALVRYGSLGISAAGAAAGVVGLMRLRDSQARFDKINGDSDQNRILYTLPDWEKARNDRNFDRAITVSGAALMVLGISGFAMSFSF